MSTVEELIEQLAGESHPLRRHQILLSARAWWQPETVSRLYAESGRRIHADVAQAERLARSAWWIARKLGDDLARAEGLRAMGHIAYLRGRSEAAAALYDKAFVIYERRGQDIQAGRTLSGSLQTLIYLGRYDEALSRAEHARAIFTAHGDRLRLARLDANVGNVLFRQDRFEEALALYQRAYGEFVEIGDPQDVAITLKNMATCQICMNDFRQALETYRQARAYSLEHEMPLLAAGADYNIAYLFYLRGEYTRSIAMYQAAREHCHQLGDTYREGLCDLDQSEMYLELNLSEEGAHLARRALGAFRQLGMWYEAAKALTNLAISSSHHGDTRLALELFDKARDLFTRENNQAWIAIIDLYQALVFYAEGRLAEAQTFGARAFAFFETSPLVGKAALCELLQARIHLDAGRLAEARSGCLSVLEKAAQSESPALTHQAYFVLGLVEEARGAREDAWQAYLKAHEQLESLRSQLKAEDLKIAFLRDKLEVYEALVRMCLERGGRGDQRAAFVYIEQAKSRSLADLMAFRVRQLPSSSIAGEPLMERVSALREEWNWYVRAIQLQEGKPVNPRQLEKLRRSARDCEHRLVEAMTHLRIQDREYASLHPGASIDLDAVRSALPEGAMILEYYRAGEQFYACLLSRRTLRIVPVGSARDLRRSLQLLRFQLSKFRLGPDYARTFQRQLLDATTGHLAEFYRQLVEPVERYLDADHLIVAPHGFLHYLPFHALPVRGGWLHSRYSISYTPSASVYYICRTRRAPATEGALVLGVPDPAAPQIAEEVAAVASAIPGSEVYLGADATDEVLRDRGARARFVHIATHGSFRQDNPMFSSINLGNTRLSLFDLYHLNLPAELVTLSGCGTGLNVVVGGDELMGLSRGLLYAGARSVLLTLWDVHDQSTADFMKLFYAALAAGLDKARAVQGAMEAIRRERPHPFYWAPFVLVGGPN
jgi:CHAT domain-containing protein/tetratricopeptide (TPR) repeat protein